MAFILAKLLIGNAAGGMGDGQTDRMGHASARPALCFSMIRLCLSKQLLFANR
jgi:hypothetical protein